MLQFKGKHSEALVFIDNVEEEVITQLYKVLNHPAFDDTKIRIMPDTHAGKGCVVGFTSTFNNHVIPNIVGVDIGCGMLSCNIGNVELDLKEIDNSIRKLIPSGFNIREKTHSIITPTMEHSIESVVKTTKMDLTRAMNSIGTLGGGNHFIEIGEDPNKNKWITIHSGSRKLGEEICKYHQAIAKKHSGPGYNQLEYLTGVFMEEYLLDMWTAKNYASMNRIAMMKELLNFIDIRSLDTIESIHNYIDTKDAIIRKGATPAHKGQKVIIPFNMRDGIAICTGKGNAEWNNSAPHGAGRVLSRTKAKEQISMDAYIDSMKGIYTTSVNPGTLDESPFAYKDTMLIMDAIKDTVDLDFLIKPIYNFKAS